MPVPEGYGFLHVEDADGNRSTIVTRDVEYARMLSEANQDALGGLEIPADKFTMSRAGWPDEWMA